MNPQNEELWNKALAEIELSVSRANFATWFKNTNIVNNSEGVVTIGVPNGFVKEWLENKYHKFVLKSIRSLLPEVRVVEYSIVSSIAEPKTLKIKLPREMSVPSEEQLDFKEFQIDPETNLNPKYTLESFIVGSFNELAHAAITSVVKNLGKAYNPLFIYGGVGLGKTHLLQAAGNKVKEMNPLKKIHYTTSEKFSNELVSSLQNNSVYNFKEKYRKYDLLIVDDIQFFSGKIKTQEEFFHTFNTLYESGKQVIFSSDRPPASIHDIEERLRSRFEAGVIVDISEPELEARIAILKSKAAEKKISLPDETIEIIASVIQKNIRELEGALNIIHIQSNHKNIVLKPDEVREILNKNVRPKNVVTPSQIIKVVAEFYDIPEKSIFEHTRKTEIVKPRQIVMYLMREDLGRSYPFIAQKFGGMDHTTAIHAFDKISKELKKNNKLEEEIKSIREKYQNLAEQGVK
ncbi:chromosomal replication initiator protein DnaA [Candidatus Giovannonibacteria bacterium]|nr:chromosomal replication initiator protein DnaA [Candidatus Giovannonibacteria bacterium]